MSPPEPTLQIVGQERRRGTGSATRGRTAGKRRVRLPPRSRRLQNFPAPAPREPERLSGAERAHQLGGPSSRPRSRDSCPALGEPGPCSLPGPQSPGPGRGRGGFPANSVGAEAERPQHLLSIAAEAPHRSLQSARRGPICRRGRLRRREGQELAQGHTAQPRGAGQAAVGWEPRASRPAVPARVPAGYSQPVLPTSSRTSSDAEWAAPMVPAAGTRGARPSQAPGWRRLRSGRPASGPARVGTPGTGLSRGFRVGRERGLL